MNNCIFANPENIMSKPNDKFVEFWTSVFTNTSFYGVATAIMDELKASELAYVLDLLGILNIFPYGKKYLNPLRDLDPCTTLFDDLIKQNYTVLLMGPNLKKLVKRIKEPRKYWWTMKYMYKESYLIKEANNIKLWPVAVHPKAVTLMRKIENAKMNPTDRLTIASFPNVDPNAACIITSELVQYFDETVMIQLKKPLVYGENVDVRTVTEKLMAQKMDMQEMMDLMTPKVSDLEMHMFQPSFYGSHREGRVHLGAHAMCMDWYDIMPQKSHKVMPGLMYMNMNVDNYAIWEATGLMRTGRPKNDMLTLQFTKKIPVQKYRSEIEVKDECIAMEMSRGRDPPTFRDHWVNNDHSSVLVEEETPFVFRIPLMIPSDGPSSILSMFTLGDVL